MSLNTIIKRKRFSASLLLIGLFSLPTVATALDTTASIKSISYASDAVIDEAAKNTLLEQADSTVITALPKEGFRSESGPAEKLTLTTSYMRDANFNIYNVSSNLISDMDYDGFYPRFSITIDVDTLYDSAYVYAKIYLSYEGGPWSYMASTNTYQIYSDSALDAFTIETELSNGFYAGYYDVRIELYDADYNEWLVSYGPYEDSSLNALPLEDTYNDNFYDNYITEFVYPVTTEVYVSGHGSMSSWLLVTLGLILIARRLGSRPLRLP